MLKHQEIGPNTVLNGRLNLDGGLQRTPATPPIPSPSPSPQHPKPKHTCG